MHPILERLALLSRPRLPVRHAQTILPSLSLQVSLLPKLVVEPSAPLTMEPPSAPLDFRS